jgi:hypothetical protein
LRVASIQPVAENMPSKAQRKAVKKTAPVRGKPVLVADIMEWMCERIRRSRFVPGRRTCAALLAFA